MCVIYNCDWSLALSTCVRACMSDCVEAVSTCDGVPASGSSKARRAADRGAVSVRALRQALVVARGDVVEFVLNQLTTLKHSSDKKIKRFLGTDEKCAFVRSTAQHSGYALALLA